MIEYLPRWITASISKYFDDNKGTYVFRVEGDDPTTREARIWVELKIDGPNLKETTRGYVVAEVDIHVTVNAERDHEHLYALPDALGYFAKLFDGVIGIYKYGPDVSDSETEPPYLGIDTGDQIGCLQRTTDLYVSNFGEIQPDVRISRGSVMATYQYEGNTNG